MYEHDKDKTDAKATRQGRPVQYCFTSHYHAIITKGSGRSFRDKHAVERVTYMYTLHINIMTYNLHDVINAVSSDYHTTSQTLFRSIYTVTSLSAAGRMTSWAFAETH